MMSDNSTESSPNWLRNNLAHSIPNWPRPPAENTVRSHSLLSMLYTATHTHTIPCNYHPRPLAVINLPVIRIFGTAPPFCDIAALYWYHRRHSYWLRWKNGRKFTMKFLAIIVIAYDFCGNQWFYMRKIPRVCLAYTDHDSILNGKKLVNVVWFELKKLAHRTLVVAFRTNKLSSKLNLHRCLGACVRHTRFD